MRFSFISWSLKAPTHYILSKGPLKLRNQQTTGHLLSTVIMMLIQNAEEQEQVTQDCMWQIFKVHGSMRSQNGDENTGARIKHWLKKAIQGNLCTL